MQCDDREDPYTYPGRNTLRNRFGIKNSARLAKVEAVFANQRMSEPLSNIARHPFREENGRTQRALLEILADRAGHHLATDKVAPARWNEAFIAGFHKADH